MTTPVTSSETNASLFTSPTASTSGETVITSDFETFLRLLTTQAQNQDPLEPIDSTEYASQLAQFSMVEQQVQANDLLSGLQEQLLSLSSLSTVTQWVGLDGRAAVDGYFDGANPVVVSPNPSSVADDVRLIIRDSSGNEINRVSLPTSTDDYEWDGRDADGNQVAVGNYGFTLESYQNDELIASATAEVYSRIRETQLLNNQVVLIMDGGSAINSTEVTALRDTSV